MHRLGTRPAPERRLLPCARRLPVTPAVRVVQKQLGWAEAEDEAAHVFWCDTSAGTERLVRLARPQKLNHFPGMLEIARKKGLARNLAHMRCAAGDRRQGRRRGRRWRRCNARAAIWQPRQPPCLAGHPPPACLPPAGRSSQINSTSPLAPSCCQSSGKLSRLSWREAGAAAAAAAAAVAAAAAPSAAAGAPPSS